MDKISFVRMALVITEFSRTLSRKRLLTKWNARSLMTLALSLYKVLM
jgi:hypothetical protein